MNKNNLINQTEFSEQSNSMNTALNKELKVIENSFELSRLITVPLKNRNTYSLLKDSSLNSFIEFQERTKKLAKEKGRVKYKTVISEAFETTDALLQYLEKPLLVTGSSPEYKNIRVLDTHKKIYDIKNNTQSFRNFKPTLSHYHYLVFNNYTKLFLEDLIKLFLNSNLNLLQKDIEILENLLKKLSKSNRNFTSISNKKKFISKLNKKINSELELKFDFFNKLNSKTKFKLRNQLLSKLNSKAQKSNIKNNKLPVTLKSKKLLKLSSDEELRSKLEESPTTVITPDIKRTPLIKKYNFKFRHYYLYNNRLIKNNKRIVSSLRLIKLYEMKKLYNLKNKTSNTTDLLNNSSVTDNNTSLFMYKSLIEDKFKLNNLGSIDQYKDINSIYYKELNIEDKKLIDALIFIDSNFNSSSQTLQVLPGNITKVSDSNANKIISNNIFNISNKKALNLSNTSNTKTNSIVTKTSYINSISPFNSQIAGSKNLMYFFNKKNNYNLFKNEKNIDAILEGAFLSMNSFISKAYFSVKPNSILINLFFFWKSLEEEKLLNLIRRSNKRRNSIRNNTNNFNSKKRISLYSLKNELERKLKFSRKFSKFAIIFERKIKKLSWVLTKLLRKRVDFQLTRIYYPQNESNILASLLGFLGFWIKFNRLIFLLISKVNFRMRYKRTLKLKYRFIPSVVSGLNIRLAGRISKFRSNNRVRTSKWQLGNSARNVQNLKINSKFTNKNRGGVFNININHNSTVID